MRAKRLDGEAQAENGACFRTLVNQASDIITILDRRGLVVYESPALMRVLGYTPEELIGTDPFALIHEDDAAAVRSLFDSIVRDSGSSVAARFRFRHKDESWRWLEVIGTNLLDDPSVKGVVINSRDVTDRHLAEQRLQASEKHHRELHAEAQWRSQELALLTEAGSALARELELTDLIRTIVDGIAQTFGYALVSLYLLEHDVLVLQHQVGYASQIDRIPVSDGIAGRVIRTGTPELVTDVRTEPTFLGAIPGIVSEICVPLHDEGRVAGILNLESLEDAPLTETDLDLLVALSQNVSVAIGRTRLYGDLRRNEARSRALLQHAADMISVLDAKGYRTYASPAYERTLGYHPDELVGNPASTICFPADVAAFDDALVAFAEQAAATRRFEARVRHRDGSPRWLDVIAVNRLSDPDVAGIVITSRDITERKALETQLWHQAHHDLLTALPNRTLFLDQLTLALSHSVPEHGSGGVSLLFLDLDGFKAVNDTFGHDAGDRLLTAVAGRLAQNLRTAEIVARFGGDEFVVLLPAATVQEAAIDVATRLAAEFAVPFEVEGHEVVVPLSIGVVSSPSLRDPAEILRAADVALYRAKAMGKGTIAVFDPAQDGPALSRPRPHGTSRS